MGITAKAVIEAILQKTDSLVPDAVSIYADKTAKVPLKFTANCPEMVEEFRVLSSEF